MDFFVGQGLLCSVPAGFFAQAAAGAAFYNHGNPTVEEQVMLELVNRARANPTAEAKRLRIGLNQGLVNGKISPSPKQPLAFHPALFTAAREHTSWMLSTNIFSHFGIGGSDADDRMADAGFVLSGSYLWAENLAGGGLGASKDMIASTVQRHDELFRSPSHRVNLCGDGFNLMGIGIKRGLFQGFDSLMATQVFAKSDAHPGPLVLGVVYSDKNRNGVYDAGEGMRGVRVSPRNGAFYTLTSATGGYAVPAGQQNRTVRVDFSGKGIAGVVTRVVPRSRRNVKVDLAVTPAPLLEVRAGSSVLGHHESLNFAPREVNKVGSVKNLVIANIGGATLADLRILKSGRDAADFTITRTPSSTLEAGSSGNLSVVFSPRERGARKAQLHIKSNDRSRKVLVLSLSGKGM